MFNIKDKYLLPKPYLSYSCINTFLTNPADFRKRYYENKQLPVTPELIFGKKVGEMVEDIINKSSDITNKTYSEYTSGGITVSIPHGDVAEKELRFEVDDIPVLGYIDSFLSNKKYIFEMKTGKTPWTQGRVEKHLQLDIYSLGVETLEGSVNDECMLIWMETERVNKPVGGRVVHGQEYDIQFTGKVREFVRVITKEDRERAYDTIVKVAQDISTDYSDWLDSRDRVTQGRIM